MNYEKLDETVSGVRSIPDRVRDNVDLVDDMTDLIEQHRAKATEIFHDDQFRTVEDANKRADQLTVALRHILCCWLLTEATPEEVMRLSQSNGFSRWENGGMV